MRWACLVSFVGCGQVPYARDRIAIHNQEMTQYFINVTVGTPKQVFTVIFDTGACALIPHCP